METASFYENLIYREDKPVLNVILQTTVSKEVRITFKKGQEMKEHKSSYPIVLQVIEGSVDFGIPSERKTLEKGMLISLEPDILHDLKALEMSIVRLSIHVGFKIN
ncbi:cupin domain-containing protein [Moheibacter sediminis]|uniref:Cupin domain protein n=1 Tax=Moheibacter sediminis TaxID=1434700 RepID=A0A1W2AQL7_9FLAO|nr:hypothetical protein [Moheibacter sediminis]SMC62975.1 hypothetical protein SAMN06296427_1059 [Moheibacter sediminis]